MPGVAAVSVQGEHWCILTNEPQYLDPAEGLVRHKEEVVAGRWGLGGGAQGPQVRESSVFFLFLQPSVTSAVRG